MNKLRRTFVFGYWPQGWLLTSSVFFIIFGVLYLQGRVGNAIDIPLFGLQPYLYFVAAVAMFFVSFFPERTWLRVVTVSVAVMATALQTYAFVVTGAVGASVVWGYVTLTFLFAVPKILPPPISIGVTQEIYARNGAA